METPWTLSATFVTVPYHCVLFTNVEKTWERKLCGSLRMCHPLLLLSASKPVPTDPELLGTYVKNMTIRVPLSCYSIATEAHQTSTFHRPHVPPDTPALCTL